MERFNPCTVVVFSNGKLIPFWKCEFESDSHFGSCFKYESESSSNTIDGIWDCKKNSLVPFFVIEKKGEADSIFVKGKKVAVERYPDITIETIKDIVYTEFEDHYCKVKDVKQTSICKGIEIPEDTKVVCIRSYKPIYIFESGNPSVHNIYVKNLKE